MREGVEVEVQHLEEGIEDKVRQCEEDKAVEPSEVARALVPRLLLPLGHVHGAEVLLDGAELVPDPLLVFADFVGDAPDEFIDAFTERQLVKILNTVKLGRLVDAEVTENVLLLLVLRFVLIEFISDLFSTRLLLPQSLQDGRLVSIFEAFQGFDSCLNFL